MAGATRMRLASQTIIVRGARHAALYDLAPRRCPRLQRIPLDIASMIERAASPRDDEQARWLAFLIAAGFVETATPPYWRPYRLDPPPAGIPALHTITIEVDRTSIGLVEAWLRQSPLSRGLHYVFQANAIPAFETPGIARRIASIIAATDATSFELFEDGSQASTIHLADGTAIGRRTRVPCDGSIVDPCRVSIANVRRHLRGSETAGQIHIDRYLVVWPHHDETHYPLGDACLQSLDAIVASDQYRTICENGKDRRDVCRDCEFRHACATNYTRRVDPHDIRSAPSACAYDPCSDGTQQHLVSSEREAVPT